MKPPVDFFLPRVLRRPAGATVLFALLVSCAPQDAGRGAFRDTAAPLGATTRFDAGKFGGDWIIRQGFSNKAGPAALTVRAGNGDALLWRETNQVCDSAACTNIAREFEARPLANGIFEVNAPGQSEARQVWVIWVDEGHRTAAIGTPDGSFGWIMDRSAEGGGDRIIAAREIMAFYGYDIALLKDVTWPG